MCSREYLTYMWHIQKKGLQTEVVNMLRKGAGLTKISEQTLYTIAYDLAEFKEYEPGETIVCQDKKSALNLFHLMSELQTMRELKKKDKDYMLSQKLTQRCN